MIAIHDFMVRAAKITGETYSLHIEHNPQTGVWSAGLLHDNDELMVAAHTDTQMEATGETMADALGKLEKLAHDDNVQWKW